MYEVNLIENGIEIGTFDMESAPVVGQILETGELVLSVTPIDGDDEWLNVEVTYSHDD